MSDSAIRDERGNFQGHVRRECGEHRTVGSHRAWCYDCSEWCYPDVPCVRCERPMLEARIAALESRVAALESRRDAERYRETVLADEREFGPSEW